MDRAVSVHDTARMLGVSPRTVSRWLQSGALSPRGEGVDATALLDVALGRSEARRTGEANEVREAFRVLASAPVAVAIGEAGLGLADDCELAFAHVVSVDARGLRERWPLALAIAAALDLPVRRGLIETLGSTLRARGATWLILDARGADEAMVRGALRDWGSASLQVLIVADAGWEGLPRLEARGEGRAPAPESSRARDLLDALSLFPYGASTAELGMLLGSSDVDVALVLAEPAVRSAVRSARSRDGLRHRLRRGDREAKRFVPRHARLRTLWAARASSVEVLSRWSELERIVFTSDDPSICLRLAASCAWAAERVLPLSTVDALLVAAMEASDESPRLRVLRARVACARASLHVKRGDASDARRHVDVALELAERTHDARWRASARLRRGELDVRLHRSDARTRADLEEAASRAALARDRIAAWIFLGNAALGPGRLDEAEVAYAHALRELRSAHERERWVVLGNLALTAMLDGRPERAVALLPQVLNGHLQEEDRLSALYVGLNLAIARVDLGRHAEAASDLRRVFRWMGRWEHRAARAPALLTWAFLQLDAGRHQQASRAFRAGLRAAEPGGFDEGCLRMGLGLALVQEPVRAHAELERAVECLERAGHRYAEVADAWRAALEGRFPTSTSASPRDAEALSMALAYVRGQVDPAELSAALATPSVLVRCAARVVAARERRTLWVAPDGSSFSRGGQRVALGAKRIPKRLLSALWRAGARGCSLEELYDAGWPQTRLPIARVRHRVHAALGALRKLGLEGELVLGADGRHRLLSAPRVEGRDGGDEGDAGVRRS